MGRSLFTGAVLFDGEAFIGGQAVLVENGEIAALLPVGEAVGAETIIELKGGVLAPGFIDAQVNGGGGAISFTLSNCSIADLSPSSVDQ